MRDTSVTDAETCEVDFMTAMCLVRRRPRERKGFNLSKFIGRGLFNCQKEIQWFVIYLRIKRCDQIFWIEN